MSDAGSDLNTYRWALMKSAEGSTDRLASQDERVHWSVVHRLLTEHGPAEGQPEVCAECGMEWPCGVVNGAVTDLRMGPAGN
ncbi:hypothetical protein AB0A74_24730 [Saccharothrix sp. NPDC042600]|uniref:hypothetical protein n=1 Tax=Saccharothrix TaxID=2071 RepID=UPI0033E77E3B|nr:hypothetical protein GCM10017745_18090 [Saccharothrix mutabilis subsp. capreolus]